MANATIGALRVVLGIDTAAFEEGLSLAQKQLQRAGKSMQRIGGQLTDVGRTLTIGVTAPLAAMGVGALKASADFEAAMIKVGISTKATAAEMAKLETAAREIGRNTTFSASEAADAMDMLAKTGLETKVILEGAAKATVDLAAAAGSDLEPAASAVSDTLQQFKLSTADLPKIVNQITGAVNESKLSFDDYSLAIGQAGGVAAGLGVGFEDFNAVLAGTSQLFSSGSDAGTSFKTFLTTLVPKSKEAAGLMKQYGLRFFEASGEMRSMSAIAEELRTKLGGLSDEAKNQVLKDIFGTDAMRTAIGLMDQGAAGLDAIKKKIAETDAAAQAAKRMEGFAGQMKQLKGALEDLGIAIGKSGLLGFMTAVVAGTAGFLDVLGKLDPALLNIAVIFAAVAAAAGPLLLVAGALVSAWGAVLPVLAAIGPALAPLLPIILPIAAAVGALVAVFILFRKQLEPAFKALGEQAAKALGPAFRELFAAAGDAVEALVEAFKAFQGGPLAEAIGGLVALLTQAFGDAFIRLLNAALVTLTTVIQGMADIIRLLTALLSGDWKGAWEAAGALVKTVFGGALKFVNALVPGFTEAMRKVYEGVKTWLQDRLAATFEWVKTKLREVGAAFKWLYDVVVGHSYIPDMVEGVAAWMAKLDAVMVEPAKKATTKTAKAFQKLRDDVASIMEGLLTDQERASRDIANKSRVLTQALDKGIITPGEAAQAAGRLEGTRPKPESTVEAKAPFDFGGLKPTGEAMGEIGEQLKASAEAARGPIATMFGDAAYNGLRTLFEGGSLKSVLNSFGRSLASAAADNLAQVLSGGLTNLLGSLGGALGSGGGGLGGLFGSIFAGGFAGGGSFMVRGRGGVDRNLVTLRATNRERVTVETPQQQRDGAMGGGGPTFHITLPGLTDARDARRAGKVVAAEIGARWQRANVQGVRG